MDIGVLYLVEEKFKTEFCEILVCPEAIADQS